MEKTARGFADYVVCICVMNQIFSFLVILPVSKFKKDSTCILTRPVAQWKLVSHHLSSTKISFYALNEWIHWSTFCPSSLHWTAPFSKYYSKQVQIKLFWQTNVSGKKSWDQFNSFFFNFRNTAPLQVEHNSTKNQWWLFAGMNYLKSWNL